MPWYIYNGGDICDSNNYSLYGNNPPPCPNPNNFLCAIQANDNMGKPIIISLLVCEIVNAVNSRTETTNVLLKP
ncbi:hypothetical protein ACFX5U_15515 [Sphingobacterium sp. SG20118]|uniref:hypothetical protein n=1 Tax=Sphingobacterium sp. SG20118 TaxID=3367156 RepID=UPI0037DFBF75